VYNGRGNVAPAPSKSDAAVVADAIKESVIIVVRIIEKVLFISNPPVF